MKQKEGLILKLLASSKGNETGYIVRSLQVSPRPAMKDFVLRVHTRAAELGQSGSLTQRARLMLELVVDVKNNKGSNKASGAATDAFDCGSWYAWFGNVSYWYEYFLVASGSSVIAMLLWGTGKLLLKKVGIQGIGISDVLAYIPGWKFISGEGLGFDLMEKMGLGRFNKPKEPVVSLTTPTETSEDMAIAKNIKSVDALAADELVSAEDIAMSGLKADAI
jgi:hypothetical protein